jgi:acetyl-CoA C-acetyltransferase
VCGAEAIATQRALQGAEGQAPDWSESPDGSLEDRGQGIELLFDGELARHGALAPIDIYPLFENARRGQAG